MRFKVTMKDPDTLHEAIADAVDADVKALEGVSDDEREAIAERRRDEVRRVCRAWFKFAEYLTVEIDTEAKTATVCPAS